MSIIAGDAEANDPGNVGASQWCECAPLPPQLAGPMAARVARTGGRWVCGECGNPVDVARYDTGAPADLG